MAAGTNALKSSAAYVAGVGVALALLSVTVMLSSEAFALDGTTTPSDQKIVPSRTYKSAREALRVGVDDLHAGDAQSSVQALTYAAEGGEPLAQWKLGSIYAAGEVVPRNDLLAYKFFSELVERYNEDEIDPRSLTAIANAFVQVGVYTLNGIPGSSVKPDPERAVELFEIAATRFGDADGQYQLARMFMDGVGGLDKDKLRAAKWLGLAAEKGHRDAQAVLGHMLFRGDGVPRQAPRGLMWLTMASLGSKGPKDGWIHDLEAKDLAVANEGERAAAEAYLAARGVKPPRPAPQPLQLSGAATSGQ
jgi:TPR repeat protein